MNNSILIEGFTSEEILSFSPIEIETFILTGQPIVFHVGTAELLGAFFVRGSRLVVELAHIEGGGEGALRALWVLCLRYARQQKLEEVEWIVHALTCANPNLKLRHVLDRRGFTLEEVAGIGLAYYKLIPLQAAATNH